MANDISSNTVVEAVGLSKIFRDFWNRPKAKAVDDIDFSIQQGEITAILGPNGSGKSTTIKMLLGLLYPTSGSATVFGMNPRDVKVKKRIGYLPEESYLYKYLTASETLDFYGALFNLSASERKKRIAQLLDMVGLGHARNRSVGEFSKGMARRIGLAQAMINDPDLLILDEPTSGLDPLGCKDVKDLIGHLRDRGKTVIICSHLLSDVEDICDKVIILYGGKIRATGTLSELLTVSDANTITTPVLKPDVMKKLITLLKKHLDEDSFKIENPVRTLEEFFLDVVSQAMSDSVETSGVVSGGKIAQYLQDDQDQEKSAAILEELTKPAENKEIKQEKIKAEKEEKAEEKARKRTSKKLEKLVAPGEKLEDQKKRKLDEKEKEKLEKANEKLKHLIK